MDQAQAISWLQQLPSNGVAPAKKELLYYRNKSNLLNLAPRRANQSKLAGNYLSHFKGRGMEFDEVRHYQQGDDPRMIDWRVTARTGKTHTKLFREEKERPVFILTDISDSMHFGSKLLFKSVQAAHLASLIAWNCKDRGDRVGGLVFNQQRHFELKPRSRQQGVLQYLHALESLSANNLSRSETNSAVSNTESGEQAFTDACARLRRLARPGSLVCIISDFHHLTPASIKHLSQLGKHCEMNAYRISDPLEHDLPPSQVRQSLLVQDGANQGYLNLGDAQQAVQYKQESTTFFDQVTDQLMRCQFHLMDISAGIPLEQHFR